MFASFYWGLNRNLVGISSSEKKQCLLASVSGEIYSDRTREEVEALYEIVCGFDRNNLDVHVTASIGTPVGWMSSTCSTERSLAKAMRYIFGISLPRSPINEVSLGSSIWRSFLGLVSLASYISVVQFSRYVGSFRAVLREQTTKRRKNSITSIQLFMMI
jgi:hypothetical protein